MAKTNNEIAAAAYGRAALAQEETAKLTEALKTATERIERMESLVRFLQENIARLTQPRPLLTEKEAAAMLSVHIQSLKRWRQERPARIPFILMEGGDVRYRAEAIESYLKSRERGNAKGVSLRAA